MGPISIIKDSSHLIKLTNMQTGHQPRQPKPQCPVPEYEAACHPAEPEAEGEEDGVPRGGVCHRMSTNSLAPHALDARKVACKTQEHQHIP